MNRPFGDVQLVDCSLQPFASFPYCGSRRLSGALRCYEVVLKSHLTVARVHRTGTPCFEVIARLTSTDVTVMHRNIMGISELTILAFPAVIPPVSRTAGAHSSYVAVPQSHTPQPRVHAMESCRAVGLGSPFRYWALPIRFQA